MDHSLLLYSRPQGAWHLVQLSCTNDASLLADKRQQEYSKIISWIRCTISFSLIRSAVMCLRGARSCLHHPARSTEEAPLDLAIHEGRISTL